VGVFQEAREVYQVSKELRVGSVVKVLKDWKD
jgi:hypothetical protein